MSSFDIDTETNTSAEMNMLHTRTEEVEANRHAHVWTPTNTDIETDIETQSGSYDSITHTHTHPQHVHTHAHTHIHTQPNKKVTQHTHFQNEDVPVDDSFNPQIRLCMQMSVYILMWYIVSILLTAANKFLLDSINFNYPMLLSFLHFTSMSLILFTVFHIPYLNLEKPCISKQTYFRFILPASFLTALEVTLQNGAMALIPISVITVIKSSLCVLTYLISVVFGLEAFSCKLLSVVSFIMISISATVPAMQTGNFIGVCMILAAVVGAAVRWVIVHHQLQNDKLTPVQLMLLTQPTSAVCIAIPALFIDTARLIKSEIKAFDAPLMYTAAMVIAASTILAILLVYSEFSLVAVSSSVTMTVAGVGKEVAVILMSMRGFHENISPRAGVGIGASIVGILIYGKMRHKQMSTHTHTQSEQGYIDEISTQDFWTNREDDEEDY